MKKTYYNLIEPGRGGIPDFMVKDLTQRITESLVAGAKPKRQVLNDRAQRAPGDLLRERIPYTPTVRPSLSPRVLERWGGEPDHPFAWWGSDPAPDRSEEAGEVPELGVHPSA